MPEVPADDEWTLETERLLLAPMTESDAAELHELRILDSDAPADAGPDVSLQRVRARIRRWERRRSPDGAEVWLNWTLRLKHDQSVVGRMQATVTECQADIAWVIGPRFRNRGYATEAGRCIAAWLVEFFDLDEVRATIHPDNPASQRVAANIGMRPSSERTGDGDEVWVWRP
ncbi:MAG: GNAT family N-acetyltransferase [Chloroflexi bacterium]|nr:GNAT family N-acetyltransferase [Chloroflexota bacterium]